MLNLSNPEQAFDASFLPADGVGLIRLDHITHRAIGVHPRALLDYPKLDRELRGAIDPIIAGYPSPREFYVQRLAESVATIAAAFHPRPVIMRMSDFTSHDYARLIGGEPYEPLETNPALGFRGAARYFSEDFAECFAMECEAFVRVREIKGLTNLALAIPRVRTPREGDRLLEQMAAHGIKRQGAGGAPLYLMADLPTHALQAEQFLARFDGFVIELAELQQLLLGMDTANPRMSRSEVDDPALRAMVEMTVACCRRMGRFVSVCADLVVDDSGMTEFLVRGDIGSLSLDPDHLLQMKSRVADAEQAVGGA